MPLLVDPSTISLNIDSSAEARVMGCEFPWEGRLYRVQLDTRTLRVNPPLFPERIRPRASDPCGHASSQVPQPSQPA